MEERVYEVIEKAKSGDTESRIFDYTILLLILFTVIAIVLES